MIPSLPVGIYYVENNSLFFNDISSNDISSNIIFKNIKYLRVYNGRQWNDYRFGDTIGGKNHNLGPNLDYNINIISKKWPNSLLHKYFLLIKSKNIGWNNLNELNILLNNHHNTLNNINYEYIALHIRVGDGLFMNAPVEMYETIISEIYKKSNIRTIIIFCGSHNCNFAPCKNTTDYLNYLIDIITKNRFNVYVRSGNSPDDDLVFMVKAKYFIPSGKDKKGSGRQNGGGYNQLVKSLRNNYNIITIT
tara:strand:- start:19 stop:765 length:747 start_codon:yes stop_codon:yes gene_type:complete